MTQSAAVRMPAHDYLAPVFAQYPLRGGVGRRRLAAQRARRARARSVRRPCGRRRWATLIRAGPRALTRAGADAATSRRNAVPMDGARCAPPRGWCASRSCDFDSVFFVNSGAEANENALKMAFRITRPRAGRRHRGRLPRPHRRGRRGHLGRRRQMVRLPAHAVRCELHAARRPRRASRTQVTARTAAVIVEPVQGLAGAVDLGAAFLRGPARSAATKSARC